MKAERENSVGSRDRESRESGIGGGSGTTTLYQASTGGPAVIFKLG